MYLRLDHGVKLLLSFLLESPIIGVFFEGQHEIKSPAWSGKTTDGLLASPLDCHKAAKVRSYKTPHKLRMVPI
jgi:hypothetical protein